MGYGPQPNNLPQFIAASSGRQKQLFATFAILFVASFIIEWSWSISVGQTLRLATITAIAFFVWNLHRRPANRTKLAWGVWSAGWAIVIGHLGGLIFPGYLIHFQHITLIAGLGLMTLMISTRVVLAHGGHSLELEKTMKSLLGISALAAFAAITRLSAGLIPRLYLSHLAYAAITWILTLIWWWLKVGRKILASPMKDEATQTASK
jgi:hypothetical protein